MKRNDSLKFIAMASMFIDHVGVLLLPHLSVLRTIGRIAYPVFAFLIAKGYKHTSSITRYRKRLFLFAIISQLPYMFLNYSLHPEYLQFNVLFLFVYATYILEVIDTFKKDYSQTQYLGILAIMTVLPKLLEVSIRSFSLSYGTYGLLLVIIFYVFDSHWLKTIIAYFMLSVITTYENGAIHLATYSHILLGEQITYFQAWLMFKQVWKTISGNGKYFYTLQGYFFQSRSMLSLILIYSYNYLPTLRMNKYVAYVFYPAHMVVLIILRIIIGDIYG